jgi:uncharacterized protein YdhG (YjbR/CyaY superfamily)
MNANTNTPAYGSIDEYIRSFPKPIQAKLKQLRSLIKNAIPEAREKISYRMPTFYLNGNVVHFAAYSKHIGFYPTSSGIANFKNELSKYKNSKGAVQFPMDEPLPIELIERIVRFRAAENRGKNTGRKVSPGGKARASST